MQRERSPEVCAIRLARSPWWPAPVATRVCTATRELLRRRSRRRFRRRAGDRPAAAVRRSARSAPLHPSFEDRAGAPDRVFAALDDDEYELQVEAWSRELERAGAHEADVLHLHHLTPINEAAARVAPQVPIVGQLHGTELLMLERIAGPDPPEWRYAERGRGGCGGGPSNARDSWSPRPR